MIVLSHGFNNMKGPGSESGIKFIGGQED
jgi:hypothetical protein